MDKTYIAIDFETSDYANNSACSIGLVKIIGTEIVDSFYTLIKPPKAKIYFTHVHGLTWTMLAGEQSFLENWNMIYSFIGEASAFVAHNASFDKRILHGTCLHYGINPPQFPFYCTLKASRKYLNLKSNTLQNVCNNLNIALEHHHALSDAMAAAKIFIHCLEQNYDVAQCYC